MAFIFISPHQHREKHRDKFYDEFLCTLHTVKNTNKNLLMVEEVFLLKYERDCYLWIVKWKLILRTFVGIDVSAKETKSGPDEASLGEYSTIQKIVHSKTSPLSFTSQCNPNALLGPA